MIATILYYTIVSIGFIALPWLMYREYQRCKRYNQLIADKIGNISTKQQNISQNISELLDELEKKNDKDASFIESVAKGNIEIIRPKIGNIKCLNCGRDFHPLFEVPPQGLLIKTNMDESGNVNYSRVQTYCPHCAQILDITTLLRFEKINGKVD